MAYWKMLAWPSHTLASTSPHTLLATRFAVSSAAPMPTQISQ